MKALGHLASLSRLARFSNGGTWTGLLFHHVTDDVSNPSEDPYTDGLGVGISLDDFQSMLSILLQSKHRFVTLDEAVQGVEGSTGPSLVLCFDDAYSSVGSLAAPLLQELNIPWTFFVNAGPLDNVDLALDNLVAYGANLHGPACLSSAAGVDIASANDFLRRILPEFSLTERAAFRGRLTEILGCDTKALAAARRLYIDTTTLKRLSDGGVEIGNHTFDHVYCRNLSADELYKQIVENAYALREITGGRVRAFAYPYGASEDATNATTGALRDSGHEYAFLVQGKLNSRDSDPFRLFRVSESWRTSRDQAMKLHVLPRLRAIRDTYSHGA